MYLDVKKIVVSKDTKHKLPKKKVASLTNNFHRLYQSNLILVVLYGKHPCRNVRQ